MAVSQQTKQRIATSKSMMKITTVMQMVSVAKLGRTRNVIENVEKYKENTLGALAHILKESSVSSIFRHKRKNTKALILSISSDKGLCGPLNNRLYKQTMEQVKNLQKSNHHVSIKHIGNKGRSLFGSRVKDETVTQSFIKDFYNHGTINEKTVHLATKEILKEFSRGEFSDLFIAYNHFISIMKNDFAFVDIKKSITHKTLGHSESDFYLVDGDVDQLLRHAEYQAVYSLILHAAYNSIACEHALRMSAMDAATRNTEKIIEQLTISHNKARQSSITSSIIDVISGSQSPDS